MLGAKSFRDHRVFVLCDVRTAGAAEVEHEDRVRPRLSTAKIARHEAAHVFREGNTQIAGTLPGAALDLRLQCNLRFRQ